MPADPVLILTTVAVVANVAVLALIVIPSIARRGRPRRAPERFEPSSRSPAIDPNAALGLGDAGIPRAAYDRVVRIVTWVFILVAVTLVVVTDLWPGSRTEIILLLALAGMFVLVMHDLLPADSGRPGRYVFEGSVAITLAVFLVALTGRQDSPFFFVFPLIVGGAALVVSPRITVALAAIAGLGYVTAVVAGDVTGIGSAAVATVAVNLTALILLAYVAMVIAGEGRRSRDAAIRLSTLDPLTTLFNRTYFFAAVEREIARSARSGRGFCILMMDLDDLKGINDRLGHFVGDRALRAVGEVIQNGVRRIDTAARYGGDEFIALLPETDPTGGYVVAEKIRQGVAELILPGTEVRTSLSIGLVSFPGDGRTTDELMISADQAMYASKRGGKNRVMGFSKDVNVRSGQPV